MNARVLTITNNKGGTAKTTTAVNLSAALRRRGFDVLLIDFDGQANLTDALRCSTTGGTIYDAMQHQGKGITPARVLSVGDGCGVLDVVPSCRDLSALEVELSKSADRLTRLGGIVDGFRDKYDVIIIDTPPALGLLSVSALYAADGVLITSQPHYLAVRGLVSLTEAIKTVEANRGESLPVSVLFTQTDKRKTVHRLIIEQVTAAKLRVYNTAVRECVALTEAPAAGLDIFRYAPRSNGAKDYDAIAGEYLTASKMRHTKHGYK